ncbi:hypothetical protein HWV62_30023 [Athelia sp. TMB]|nr:hypothetical protein HWV62_30023 [Athelia sp. TMB]
MDTYFKICRAQEEIKHLNIKIHRFVTQLCDEDHYLEVCKEQEQTRFRDHHFRQVVKISQLPSFTSSILLGKALNNDLGASVSVPCMSMLQHSQPMDAQEGLQACGLDGLANDTKEDLEEEDVAVDEESEVLSVVHDVV